MVYGSFNKETMKMYSYLSQGLCHVQPSNALQGHSKRFLFSNGLGLCETQSEGDTGYSMCMNYLKHSDTPFQNVFHDSLDVDY